MTTQQKALRLALEALEQWNTPLYKRGTVITAIKEALETKDEPKLIGWRTADFLNETTDIKLARNWEVHYEVLPIFEGDPNTKLVTTPQPKQEQDELVSMRMPKVGDRVVCIEDESLGVVHYLTSGGSPEIRFDDGSHGTYLLREFAELFGYADTNPPQRTWVGLTDEEIEKGCKESWVTEQAWQSAVWWAEAKLKDKNGY
jgi:hypothetical protein